MTSGNWEKPLDRPFPFWLSWSVSLLLIVAVAILDYFSSAGLLIPILYVVPLVLGTQQRGRGLTWSMALLCVVLVFGVHLAQMENWLLDPRSIAFLNRVLAAAVILILAAICHALVVYQRSVLEHHRSLAERTASLETVNRALAEREAEIVRQNEELQSQTEKLRVANVELGRQQSLVEELLELSRSLTAELSPNEMLTKICNALGQLTRGSAAAILEVRGQELVVRCHHGFPDEGPADEVLPLAHSFASLVLNRMQTGQLADIVEQRPDLRTLRPRSGERFHAVMAAPLWVRGRAYGTIEVYRRQRHSWNEEQIALIESIAAQTAISLESAELVEAIQHERRRFEGAFNTMPFGLAVAEDAAGEQVRLNPAGAALLNVAVDENIALTSPAGIRIRRHFVRAGHPVRDEDLPLSRALQGMDVRGDELELVLPTGRRLVLLVSASPLYDARSKIAGAICGFADITAMKDLQRELDLRRREAEEASVRKTRFLAAISHDIRTPVNAMSLLAELLRRTVANPALGSDLPQLVEKLQANAVSLIDLINDLLDVARFDQGKLEFQESEFLLNDLIAEECRQLAPLAQQKRLGLVVEPAEAAMALRTDRIKLARILGNLIGNAIKFTETGSVHVQIALLADRRAQIRVADTGVGIAPEQLPRIFDEFTQLRNPERDRSKGTGLGLAICKRLTEAMGGTIGVESMPGQGTTMTVTLPASCVLMTAASAPPQAPARPSSLPGLAGLRVLLVEDHFNTRQATVSLLEREGAQVREASTGRDALTLLANAAPQVILLDMMLPDMDGTEVLKAIQARRPPGLAGVLVLTGDLTPGRQEEVKRLGADELVAKPIDVNDLVARLRRVKDGERGV